MTSRVRVLATFPGKFGDLLWALPTVRAISRRVGEPVDLMIGRDFASIHSLLTQQSYIGQCWAQPEWRTEDTAPISPRVPTLRPEDQAPYDLTLHLGYRGWPDPDLMRHTLTTAQIEIDHAATNGDVFGVEMLQEDELALSEPWIVAPPAKGRARYRWSMVYGFTDEYFELKYGLVQLLERRSFPHRDRVLPSTSIGGNPRWRQEAGYVDSDWTESAQLVSRANVCLGDCSALHVLAVAVGTPAVLMEPATARHNPVFYPLGQTGPQVTLVRGGDGHPTFDARHVRDALEGLISRRLESST